MRIQSNTGYPLPNLYSLPAGSPQLQETAAAINFHDTVELSTINARQLPDEAIEHATPSFFFNTEINASLDKVLTGKSPEVSKAAYQILGSNFFLDVDLRPEERSALLETGLSQAKFLADNYMTKQESSEFLQTMHLLAAVAATRKVDPATGNVSYVDLPQKPAGAPNDYVSAQRLMERFDPESAAKLQAAVASGNNTGGILIQFAGKLRQHPEWVSQYREEQDQLLADLKNTRIDNRFEGVTTSSLAGFVQAMNERSPSSDASIDLLRKNVSAFAKQLGYQV